MSDVERLGLLAYARSSTYQRRLDQALRYVEEGLARCERPYVATSFGKDSAALLHLVAEVRPDIEARFIRWGESELLHEYSEVMDEWARRWPQIRFLVLDLDRDSINERVPGRWQQLQAMDPADGYFIGLRAEESHARQITLRSHGVVYQATSGVWRISPLAWWTVQDVAAYNVVHDLPRLRAYDVEGWGTRTTARVPRDTNSIRHHSLAQLRMRDPTRYNLLCQKFPEVARYV